MNCSDSDNGNKNKLSIQIHHLSVGTRIRCKISSTEAAAKTIWICGNSESYTLANLHSRHFTHKKIITYFQMSASGIVEQCDYDLQTR
jgi:hypothetical protein